LYPKRSARRCLPVPYGHERTMISLRRIHHVCLRVDDLDAAVRRWSIQFGLTERERGDRRAYLACDYEPYSLELVEAAPAGHDHTGYELARGVTLEDLAAHLDGLGVEHRRGDDAIHLRDPDGAGIELRPFAASEDPRPPIARSTTTLPAFHPRKLGHVNALTGDLEGMTQFYCDALGMRVTDRLGDEGTWLHVNADHHTLALVGKGYAHLHHLAFELIDWGELRVALDHLAQHGRWLAWGPVRHALGRNLSAYVRIPEEECFVELFSDMEQLEPDHEPRDWPDDAHSSNTWGILPPRSYFRFDTAAVQAEREGLEALGHPLPAGGS
jgi:catechol 2,3-dioxygenase-like lactoylglutathione lyase family enzyme